jgi:hypothetical protein
LRPMSLALPGASVGAGMVRLTSGLDRGIKTPANF